MIISVLELVVVSFAYALFTVLLQRRLANVDKMYEIRARMNMHQKSLMAMLKGNADKDAISKKQKEVMEASTESMKLQMKPMLVVFPLFLILYYVLLPLHFNMSATATIFSITLSYHWLFIGLIFLMGIVFSVSFSIYDRKRLKDKYNFGIMQPSFKEAVQSAEQ